MTGKNSPDRPFGFNDNTAKILDDEKLAGTVSAYLDGELAGNELEAFEELLRTNKVLAREIQELRRIEGQLAKMGADILSEPVPEALLEALELPKDK